MQQSSIENVDESLEFVTEPSHQRTNWQHPTQYVNTPPQAVNVPLYQTITGNTSVFVSLDTEQNKEQQ